MGLLKATKEIERMSESSSNSGIGFISLLTILFVGLKLAGYINWSWWWVLSPLWIVWVFIGIYLVGGFIIIQFKYK